MRLLILTLCNGSVNDLEDTLESIDRVRKSVAAIEFVVRLVISHFSRNISELPGKYHGLDVSIVSWTDTGISNAMNIGLDYADKERGSFSHFIFLHAGDRFIEEGFASSFEEILMLSSYDSGLFAYHGPVLKGNSLLRSNPFDLDVISGINHCGLIQSIGTARLASFDETLVAAMDYDYILMLKRRGVVFREYSKPITYADPHGVTKSLTLGIARELLWISKKHFYKHRLTRYLVFSYRCMKISWSYLVSFVRCRPRE